MTDDAEDRERQRRRESDRRYRESHPDKVRDQARRWREANAERRREYQDAWRLANLDRYRELNRESMRRAARRERAADTRRAKGRAYYQEHAEERRAYTRNYIARKYAEDPEGFTLRRRERQRAWYQRHRERLAAAQAVRSKADPAEKRDYANAYYRQHQEEVKAKRRAYYAQNKDLILARQREWAAKQRERVAAGLPKRNLHRTPRDTRRANQRAAADFFTRHIDIDARQRLLEELRTPPDMYAAWKRDCLRARAAHHDATTPRRPARRATAEQIEAARMDAIAREINDRLRAGSAIVPRPQSADPSAPLYGPNSPQGGLSR